jgi:hypothetical protein
MQNPLDTNLPKTPAVVLRKIAEERLAIRFNQIGNRQRFGVILMRFRADFPLAVCQELESHQPWWIISLMQHEELLAFAKRNGLQVMEVL